MKKQLLMKTFLVAVCLLGGGNVAWAENMTTMTGVLGLTDNSAAWWTYYSKAATIKKGESYTYTFKNYDLQDLNDESGSFIAEIRDNSTGYCFDIRGNSDKSADNAGWKWDGDPTTNTLNYSFSGKAWSDFSYTASTFKTAYNGVTVTLTITRSADGGTVTVTRAATLNDETDFPGTWTCSGFSNSDDMTIKLVALYAHQDITKVSHTNASNVVTTYERKSVDLSQFTGDFCSYDAGVVTFSVSSNTQKWCTLDLSSYYSTIPGLITDVNMTLTENITCTSGDPNTGTNRLGIGIYGDTRESFNKPTNADRYYSVSWWGVAGKNADVRIYYGTGNTYVNGLTLNADTKIDVWMNMLAKTFSWYQGGTQKVNGQSFYDNTITLPKYLAVQSWSTPVQATISDMSLEIVYLSTIATITPAGWSTFASTYPLDLSSLTASTGDVTAYYASEATGSTVTLSVTTAKVPAGEGIMLKGTAGATITIPVTASGTAISGNKLKGQTTTGNVAASSTDGKYHYVFGYKKPAEVVTEYGFYNLASTTEVAAGKAYLETTTSLTAGARIAIVFEDETTGITSNKRETISNNRFFDLQGREIAQPTKGLYIMNGKKVVVK